MMTATSGPRLIFKHDHSYAHCLQLERNMTGHRRIGVTVIDIYQQPGLAKGAQIVAAPTLVRTLPLPLRRVIGDLSDLGRILLVLGVAPAPREQA